MVADYDRRLQNLRDRRQGISKLQKSMHAMDSAEAIRRGKVAESYERRSSNKATRYALGSMQAVNADYTANSVAEGDRVRGQLRRGHEADIPVAFEYQGSVPLDVHIRGVSDIDLLVLRNDFVTIDQQGPDAYSYGPWGGDAPVLALARLRSSSERIVKDAFPEATVTTAGGKSITIEGGSLRRKVDVVPSHWHDTAGYQASRLRKDRGIYILDKHAGTRSYNLPFLHMHQIDVKDRLTSAGAKKVIRLLKNLRNDSDYAASIKLSSYDIAGVVWHFDDGGLTVAPWQELALLHTASTRLRAMIGDKAGTMRRMTPDGTRCVIDDETKFTGLVLLSLDVDQLCEEVAKEVAPHAPAFPNGVQKGLQESYVP